MNTAIHRRHRQMVTSVDMRGLSLVELMVALVISSLILLGLIQVFSANRVTYQADEGLARLQENARFAIEFLSRDLRNAGNLGCKSSQDMPAEQIVDITTASAVSPSENNLASALAGFNAIGPTTGGAYTLPTLYPPATTTVTNPALDAALMAGIGGIVVGSDVVVTHAMGDDSVPLVGPNYDDGRTLQVAKPNNLQNGQLAMVSNCDFTLVFKAQVAHTGGGVPYDLVSHPLGTGNICDYRHETGSTKCERDSYKFRFGESGLTGSLRTAVFYIGPGTNGGPSLFRRTFPAGVSQDDELVEGVENMQILYGLDENNNHTSLRYVPADAVTNWQRVQSVRIGLLVATSNVTGSPAGGSADTAPDTQVYRMQDTDFTVNPDRHRRRVFDTTIYIRNRHAL